MLDVDRSRPGWRGLNPSSGALHFGGRFVAGSNGSGFSPFAAGGKRPEITFISEIEDERNRTVHEGQEEGTEVLDP